MGSLPAAVLFPVARPYAGQAAVAMAVQEEEEVVVGEEGEEEEVNVQSVLLVMSDAL